MFKRTFQFLLFAVICLSIYLVFNTLRTKNLQIEAAQVLPLQVTDAAVARLAKAVQCPTNSSPLAVDTTAFIALHRLIDSSFGLCNTKMERKIVNQFSLLYKWSGSDTSLAPIVLLAHLDVVPVEGVAVKKWSHAPYGGEQANGMLWGRGTLDDKMSAFGLLEAAEMLLQKDFQPKRTVYFAFGHDEEVGGANGAKAMAAALAAAGVHAEMVLDEGMVVLDNALPGLAEKPLGLIGIAEKGYATLELKVLAKGGHSSMPPAETAIGTLSQAIVNIEKHPMAARFSLPVNELLDYAGPEMSLPFNIVMTNRWLFAPLLMQQFAQKPSSAALLRTTIAPTILQAGVKDNVLPTEAIAHINYRILPGETSADVLQHAKTAVNDSRVQIKMVAEPTEPSPVSDTKTPSFEGLAKLIRGYFPKSVVAPALVIGGTDSKYYSSITKNIYRFSPIELANSDLGRIHGVDECISIENYKRCIRFYYGLLSAN